MRGRILLLEDDPSIRTGLGAFLRAKELEVEEAATLREALEYFQAAPPDIVVADYSLPDGNSLDLLPRFRQEDVPVVILTGHGSIDLAVKAIKEGAEQFLTKPVDSKALLILLDRLLEQRRLKKRQAAASRKQKRSLNPFCGQSPAIRRLEEQARLMVTWDSPLLILGETGAGKGILARWLHTHGPRREEAFVNLNCAGLSRELLDSELFGFEKGAFTGAVAAKPGLLEVAHRGIVFLDEIGDMDLAIQPKLLKALEEKSFRRLGDVRDRTVDIRLLASTNLDLEELVRQKRFRDDLFYRVSTLTLRIPPLRERTEDIPELAQDILEDLMAKMGRTEVRFTPMALDVLRAYPWPGNVRELRNVLERALILQKSSVLEAQDLGLECRRPSVGELPENRPTQLKTAEKLHIQWVLERAGGNVAEAARLLGIARRTLYDRLKNMDLS